MRHIENNNFDTLNIRVFSFLGENVLISDKISDKIGDMLSPLKEGMDFLGSNV